MIMPLASVTQAVISIIVSLMSFVIIYKRNTYYDFFLHKVWYKRALNYADVFVAIIEIAQA